MNTPDIAFFLKRLNPGTPPPANIKFYNNSMETTETSMFGVREDTPTSNIECKFNVFRSRNFAFGEACEPGSGLIISDNLSNPSVSPWTTTPPLVAADFRLNNTAGGGALAIDASTSGGIVVIDFDGARQALDGDGDGVFLTDFGAYESTGAEPPLALKAPILMD
jgi:hypothetical protein